MVIDAMVAKKSQEGAFGGEAVQVGEFKETEAQVLLQVSVIFEEIVADGTGKPQILVVVLEEPRQITLHYGLPFENSLSVPGLIEAICIPNPPVV